MNKPRRRIKLISRINTILLLIFIASCSDPEANIKELEGKELSNVIEKLYIEKDAEQSAANENEATNADKELLLSSEENNKSVSSITNNDIVQNEVEKLPETNTTVDKVNSDNIATTLASTEPTNTEENTSFADTGFSEPVTESETPSERILRELLEQYPTTNIFESTISSFEENTVNNFCEKISARLSSVSMQGCQAAKHRVSQFNTVEGNPIVVTEFAPLADRQPLGKILVIGGTHGDELTSVSTSYKWIANLNKFHSGLFHWHIAPAINADSIFKRPATRQNANGVDINRNLPTPDWDKQSEIRWQKLSQDPRKNPGTIPASEPETQWLMHEIESFKPDAIVSIHAPYGLLDFDSPKLNNAPKSFGRLQLNLLGTYPGSLGNYAGIQNEIPVLTLELPNASSMPSQDELNAIWSDMIKWLRSQLEN